MTDSKLEKIFLSMWRQTYPRHPPVQEFRFHITRKWRMDFAWPDKKVFVEIQGFGPGHNSLVGMATDYEKLNAAVYGGWKPVYLTGQQITAPNLQLIYAILNDVPLADAAADSNDSLTRILQKIRKANNPR